MEKKFKEKNEKARKLDEMKKVKTLTLAQIKKIEMSTSVI